MRLRKILSLVLTICMVLMQIPATVYAESDLQMNYEMNDDETMSDAVENVVAPGDTGFDVDLSEDEAIDDNIFIENESSCSIEDEVQSAEEQSAEEQSAEEQSAEEQSAEEQSAEEQNAEEQSTEEQSTENIPSGTEQGDENQSTALEVDTNRDEMPNPESVCDETQQVFDRENIEESLSDNTVKIEETGSTEFREEKVIDDIVIIVSAPDGVFPAEAELWVEKIDATNSDLQDIEAAVINTELNSHKMQSQKKERIVFDIKVLDKNGEELEPDTEAGNVEIQFQKLIETDDITEVGLYHIEDNTDAVDIEDDDIQSESIIEDEIFDFNDADNCVEDLLGGHEFSLNPAEKLSGSSLCVFSKDRSEENSYLEEDSFEVVEENVQDKFEETITGSRVEEEHPYLISNFVATELDVSASDDFTGVSVETTGFSYYVVEFWYNSYEYVLSGDSEIELSVILEELGITIEQDEILNVDVSDSELFDAFQEEIDGEQVWIIRAVSPFTTDEWLRIDTVNGESYNVEVTDSGGSWDDAYVVTFGQDIIHTTSGGMLYAKFTVTEQGYVTIDSEKPFYLGVVPIEFRIYSERKALIWGADCEYQKDNSYDYYEYCIGLSPGVYYLTQRFGKTVYDTISYEQTIYFDAKAYCECEANNTKKTANWLSQPWWTSAWLGSDGSSVDTQDWFAFEAIEDNTYSLYIDNYMELQSTSAEIHLINPKGVESDITDEVYEGEGELFFSALYSGGYYIKLFGYNEEPVYYAITYRDWTRRWMIQDFVTRLYEIGLDREPDSEGLYNWVIKLETGENDGIQVAYSFLFSDEFKAKNYCNTCYVEHLYLALMGREADEAGLRDWVEKLKNRVKREEVFNGFAGSDEFAYLCDEYEIIKGDEIPIPERGTKRTGQCAGCGAEDEVETFVRRLYIECLDREADPSGLESWCCKLRDETLTGTETAASFLFSDEFKAKSYCSTCFVEHLYRAMMGRDADPEGKASWVKNLTEGMKREEVFNGFSGSKEFTDLCKTYGIVKGDPIDVPPVGTKRNGNCAGCGAEDEVEAFVKRLYKECLDREADQEGLDSWSKQLREETIGGVSTAHGFIFSQEFIKHDYTDVDYVEHLYRALMDRASDPKGKADWVRRLEAGETRENVFNCFGGSDEFRAICKKYGIKN